MKTALRWVAIVLLWSGALAFCLGKLGGCF